MSRSLIGRAELLQSYLSSLETQISQGNKLKLSLIPHYSFYTQLLEKLIEGHRKFGMSLKVTLQELKSNLIKEIQFEKKCLVVQNNGKLQFVMMSLTTWGFIFFTSFMVEVKMRLFDFFIILFLQFLGAICFFKVSQVIKERCFSKYTLVIERLYLFVNMVDLGFSNGRAISESLVLEGPMAKEEVFLPCASRLDQAIMKWKDAGISPKGECKDILEEIWHQKTMSFEQYLKQLEALKFSVLAGFYLPAYFYYLYSIFQFFMEQ